MSLPTRPLLIDGGLATALEARGHTLHRELWSGGVFLENPGAVESVHREFLEAGAEIVISASYQMSFAGLARAGLDRHAAARTLASTVEVARRACEQINSRALVAASVGPYGAVLGDGSEYRGDYALSKDQLAEFHRERLAVLAHADADMLAIETVPSLPEAEVLLELLAEHPQARAWFSFACRDGERMGDGQPLVLAAKLLDGSPQVAAIGVNCTAPRFVSSLMRHIRAVSSKPIVVYPNSGERWDAQAKCWTGPTEEDAFVRLACEWAAEGAWAIGGCCRVGPELIRKVARALHPP